MPLSDLWDSQTAEPTHEDGPETSRLRRFVRTSKARAASLLSRQRRKLQRMAMANCDSTLDLDVGAQRVFQQKFLASSTTQWDPLEDTGSAKLIHHFDDSNGRRRAVCTYLKAFATGVRQLFCGDSEAGSATPRSISHVISVHTNDDTNMKLGSGVRGSSEIRSVMNNIQEHIVFSGPPGSEPVWFHVHQPIVALERADTSGLYQAFMAWVLGFTGYTGWRLRPWGLPANLFRNVSSHTHVYVGDALKVNNSVFKYFTQCVRDQDKDTNPTNPSSTSTCALQIRCLIHQVSLTRRYLALGFPGFFSNLVRLGHLYENHSFRQKFKATLSKLLQQNFVFVPVAKLPESAQEWHELKVRELRLHTDGGHMGGLGGRRPGRDTQKRTSTRFKALQQLLQKDNGNPASDSFVHFCVGESCCRGGAQEALSSMVQSYLDLFGNMMLPLLYRWKHCSAASHFVRDGCILHRVLPRVLAAMPTFKGLLAFLIWAERQRDRDMRHLFCSSAIPNP